MYFLVRGVAKVVVYSFFREITVLNPERIPLYGPVIFVGNHNNQFVDASMLYAMLPRHVRFLIAEKSLKRPIIGSLAQGAGSISVARSQDKVYDGLGLIKWNEGSTVIEGVGTRFLLDVHPGDRVKIKNEDPIIIFTVKEIISDLEFHVNEVLPSMPEIENHDTTTTTSSTENLSTMAHVTSSTSLSPLMGSVPFMVLPRVDQSDVYEAVSDALIGGVFPEGGSHDRFELLPLKPGVAIMALRAALEGAEDVMVVPIGRPLTIPDKLVDLYAMDRRAAVSELLKEIEENLKRCIVSAPNYQSLKAVKMCASLYIPESMDLPADRFSLLFNKHQNDPKLTKAEEEIFEYGYGIADHEVRQLRYSIEEAIFSFCALIFKLLLSIFIGLPLLPLWGPLRLFTSYAAEKHRKKALAESNVKITGRDVVASHKILTMMVLVPTANLIYGLLFGLLYCKTWTGVLGCIVACLTALPLCYFYSIRYAAKIIPLLRKFRFILLVIVSKLNAWRDTERAIITRRMQMQLIVRQLVQELGPSTHELFLKDMDSCVPEVVIAADSKRIRRRLEKGDFVPISSRTLLENREEIL